MPDPWYCDDAAWHRHWLEAVTEMIDRYQPDLLYSDGPYRSATSATTRPRAVAHLYNTSARIHGTNRAVYQQKDRRPEVSVVGVMDIERSQTPGIHSAAVADGHLGRRTGSTTSAMSTRPPAT